MNMPTGKKNSRHQFLLCSLNKDEEFPFNNIMNKDTKNRGFFINHGVRNSRKIRTKKKHGFKVCFAKIPVIRVYLD